ncbi:MAG: glycosyltransferase family 4 protein [Intrasporangiaceae bacterium]|nr:glycosyltransferase family 4 protein [Intrasporangiaceae bacterium]
MRIAYVCNDPGIPAFGSKGASVHIQELLRAYVRLGHEMLLITARPGGDPPADLKDVEVIDIGRATTTDTARRELATAEIDRRIEAVLADRHDLDLVHERYSLWGGGGIRAAARLGCPSILEVNAPLIEEQATHRDLVHLDLARDHLTDAARRATVMTAVSQPVAAWLGVATGHSDHVIVLPNGVDPARFHPQPIREQGPFTVGFVGTLKPWHGVDVLVQAMASLRRERSDLRLLLVGDGPQATDILATADRMDVPVEHTGALAPADVPRHLARMDIACAPYPATGDVSYFSPLKVLEYLAAGVPVIASEIGQLPHLLDAGRCGVLTPPGDADALASAIDDLLADRDRRTALAHRGRQRVERHHTWQYVAAAGIHLAMTTTPEPVGANR